MVDSPQTRWLEKEFQTFLRKRVDCGLPGRVFDGEQSANEVARKKVPDIFGEVSRLRTARTGFRWWTVRKRDVKKKSSRHFCGSE